MTRQWGWVLLIGALMGSWGCDSGTEPASAMADPSQVGPFAVGTRAMSFRGRSGVELPVQVWFPVISDAQTKQADPFYYESLFTGIALDISEPSCDEVRPVFLFSHGDGGTGVQSIFLTEHLASHGYVVAAPDHTYNTYYDYDEAKLGEVMLRRPHDMADTFDWVLEQSQVGEWLSGCVNLEDGYAIGGHSFGGFTTVATAGAYLDVDYSLGYCSSSSEWLCNVMQTDTMRAAAGERYELGDPRVWAMVPMSPAGFEVTGAGLTNITVPALILGGGRDVATTLVDQVEPLFEGLTTTPRFLGVVPDAGHETFSNACDLMPVYEACTDPAYAKPKDVQMLSAELTAAFLYYVRGISEAEQWLSPSRPDLEWTRVE